LITVFDSDGEAHRFEDASGYQTDEHNNLEIAARVDGAIRPVACFNRTDWRRTEIDYG